MNFFKKIAYGASAIVLSVPMIVGAQTTTSTSGFAVPTTGLPGEGSSGSSSLISIATGIMNWLLVVVGILGVVGFVIAGIIYLTAAGDDTQIEKGKNAMVYSIVGVIVALMGVVIINAVQKMLGGTSGGTF